jgi:hypothetical protein
VCVQNRRLWVRLRENGGKAHAMPCRHSLKDCLIVDLEQACIIEERQGTAAPGHRARRGSPARPYLRRTPPRWSAEKRATTVGIATKVGNHSVRATGITAYLTNGGTLEKVADMANHASIRTT